MRTFSLQLQDATHTETIDGVASFVGEDATGSFGILGGHVRMMTALTVGLARFRTEAGAWRYLAVPGAIVYFNGDMLTLTTHRYLIDDDYTRISQALREQLLAEEEQLIKLKESVHRLDNEVLQRLWALGRAKTG